MQIFRASTFFQAGNGQIIQQQTTKWKKSYSLACCQILAVESPCVLMIHKSINRWRVAAAEPVWISARGGAGGVQQPWHEDGDSGLWLRLPPHHRPWRAPPAHWRRVSGAYLHIQIQIRNTLLSVAIITIKRIFFFTDTSSATLNNVFNIG